jgi:hypothetical protein
MGFEPTLRPFNHYESGFDVVKSKARAFWTKEFEPLEIQRLDSEYRESIAMSIANGY